MLDDAQEAANRASEPDERARFIGARDALDELKFRLRDGRRRTRWIAWNDPCNGVVPPIYLKGTDPLEALHEKPAARPADCVRPRRPTARR